MKAQVRFRKEQGVAASSTIFTLSLPLVFFVSFVNGASSFLLSAQVGTLFDEAWLLIFLLQARQFQSFFEQAAESQLLS